MKILVLGAGPIGLAASMMLARDGHDVTIVERDPAPAPDTADQAWDAWERRGVAQFRQPHFMQAGARRVLETELPDVLDAMIGAGALRIGPVPRMPTSVRDCDARAGDERLVAVTARRPVFEQMLARAADAEPGLELRRGAAVSGLTARLRSGVPNVTGVRLESGETIAADLVVDAMGRRSQLPRLLRACGVEHVPEQAEDPGFAYYTRYFRSSGGMPELRALQLTPVGSFSIITLPADDGTWSVTLLGSSSDRPLKRLRFEDTWNAVVRACPLHAHWLDGESLTGVLAMGGMVDRYRRYVVDGRPVATGIAAIGDAWACTNPSLGRGIALGLAHAARLRELVRTAPADPHAFALDWDAVTERHLTPWYRATVATDRARFAEIEALRAGRPALAATDRAAALRTALPLAMGVDADVFRAAMEVVNCLTLPQHVFARPGFVDRVLEVARAHNGAPPSGPDREQLLELLAAPESQRRGGGALRAA